MQSKPWRNEELMDLDKHRDCRRQREEWDAHPKVPLNLTKETRGESWSF